MRPTTAAEVTNGIAGVCGTTNYALFKTNTDTAHTYTSTWAVISAPSSTGVYTLTIDTTKDLSLIASEATVTIPLYIRATLNDYNTLKSYTLLNIKINEVTCNCASLAWDNPSSGVDITSTQLLAATAGGFAKVLVKPTANDGAKSTVPAFQKCYTGAGCSSDGVITAIQWSFGGTTAAKPSWITWPKSDDTDANADASKRSTKIVLIPADGTQKGTHSIIATWTPKYGSASTFTALTFKVGCEVASFTVSGAPGSNPTYNVFSSRKIIPLTSVTYTQVPACGYTFTKTFGHTIPSGTAAAIIFAGATVVPSFEIYTTTASHVATYAVSLTSSMTIGGSQD